MNISIAVPDDLLEKLQNQWGNVSKRTLEALAIEAYRSGSLTSAEIQRMLNLSSRWHVDDLLKRARLYFDYTEEDLQHDLDTIRELESQ